MGEGSNKTQYTEDGLIILPPNVLIPKNVKKPRMIVMDFSTIQMKREKNFLKECMDEMMKMFSFRPSRTSAQRPDKDNDKEV